MTQCPNCGAGYRPGAARCVKCGSVVEVLPPVAAAPPAGAAPAPQAAVPAALVKNPAIAALLSLFVPGLGQVYNGQLGKGIVFFVLSWPAWIVTCGTLGWIVHVVAAIEAHEAAKRINRGGQA